MVKNNNFIEKVSNNYVLASLDKDGNTVYLRYLLNYKWEITSDIERASKMNTPELAKEVLNNYYYDTNCVDDIFVIIPMKITWELVKEF